MFSFRGKAHWNWLCEYLAQETAVNRTPNLTAESASPQILDWNHGQAAEWKRKKWTNF